MELSSGKWLGLALERSLDTRRELRVKLLLLEVVQAFDQDATGTPLPRGVLDASDWAKGPWKEWKKEKRKKKK